MLIANVRGIKIKNAISFKSTCHRNSETNGHRKPEIFIKYRNAGLYERDIFLNQKKKKNERSLDFSLFMVIVDFRIYNS